MAITGGLACGKSEVGRIWAEAGVPVFDTDAETHRCLRPGSPVFRAIVRRFGRDVLGTQGAVDRRRLGAVVFGDAQARGDLEAIVHPAVFRAVTRWCRKAFRTSKVAAVMIPLLFETGATAGWTDIVCVTAPAASVRRRLAGRGLTPREMQARLRAQWPVARKVRQSDHVIDNRGSLAALKTKALQVLRRVIEQGEEKP